MVVRRDISLASPATPGSTDTYADNLDIDVIIVGAGFGGIYLLHKLRDELGLKVKLFEAGTDIGGIWHWNCYPGARVDSDVPVYEYSIEKVWKDWYWGERFPAWPELRRYFDHVDKVLDIRKDVALNTKVISAQFNQSTNKWVVMSEDGRRAKSTYLILATGFAAKRHFPDWKGIDSFKGAIHHSSFWPEDGIDVSGKRVAVIGTGSTGVQIAQEWAKEAKELTVFQRTPNLALPMQQRKMTKDEQDTEKVKYPEHYKTRLTTFAGFLFTPDTKKTLDDSPEEREKYYQRLFDLGGFHYWVGNYADLLYTDKPNREAYNFWAKKTRARITDPRKRDILAPLEPPHPFGTKRPSLEQDFYEQFNKPNVDVVDIKANPIKEILPEGILLEDGTVHELDVIALATGFDSVTGGMKNMGLKSVDGVDLAEKWKMGTWTHLGMTCNGFPNLFFPYGAQGEIRFPYSFQPFHSAPSLLHHIQHRRPDPH